jgi:hypothetical protein
MIQLSNGSYSSRKFVLALVCLTVITIVSLLTIYSTAIAPILPSFIGGIIGVLTVYLGGNIANAHIQGKADFANLTAKLQAGIKPVETPNCPDNNVPDKSKEHKEAETNP